MKNDKLIRVNKYSNRINELNILKRIEINLPIFVRNDVAKKLATVANNLPQDIYLQIDSGFRLPKTEEHLWNNRVKQLGLEKTKQLVAEPGKSIPSHTTGGAVDVSLLDNNFKEINLSAPFQKYYEEQFLYSKKITKEAQELRLVLNKIMLKSGFAPHDKEYWHFSYGDERWAKYYNRRIIYEQLVPNRNLHYSFLQKFLIKVVRKVYKFFNKLFSLKTSY